MRGGWSMSWGISWCACGGIRRCEGRVGVFVGVSVFVGVILGVGLFEGVGVCVTGVGVGVGSGKGKTPPSTSSMDVENKLGIVYVPSINQIFFV